jgi:hypothetical protein
MPFCPNCCDEFQDWVKVCPDCGFKLVNKLLPLKTKHVISDNLVTIATFSFPEEAHLSRAKLKSQGIKSYVADELAVIANNLRGVRLQVKESDVDEALRILQLKIRKGN